MNTTVRFLLTAILLLAMVSHAHTDTASAQAEASRTEVVLEASEIDSNTVEVGIFVVVVYEQKKQHPVLRRWEQLVTTRGYVQAIDVEALTLALERNGRPQRIALERIQRLTLVRAPSPEAEQDGVQIDASRADSVLKEMLDTLSVKTDDKAIGVGKRIAVKLLVGSFLGGASGLGLGNALASDCTGCLDLGGVFGFFIGYTAGTAVGVSLVDSHDKFIVSLLGSMVGVAGGYRLSVKAEDFWPFVVSSSVMATLASELSRTDYLPPIFMSRKPRHFSVGLMPNFTGRLSAVATLRF